MRISDWSSDVCSSDLPQSAGLHGRARHCAGLGRFRSWRAEVAKRTGDQWRRSGTGRADRGPGGLPCLLRPLGEGREKRSVARVRSEEHTSELQSLMRISYAVFCLKKKKTTKNQTNGQRNRQ